MRLSRHDLMFARIARKSRKLQKKNTCVSTSKTETSG
nr:MAG TPA: hypothetical protein [Caudoviricetes sp.]